MIEHSAQIEPRPAYLGGGWWLPLLERGEEVGGDVLPAGPSQASQVAAHKDAWGEASI